VNLNWRYFDDLVGDLDSNACGGDLVNRADVGRVAQDLRLEVKLGAILKGDVEAEVLVAVKSGLQDSLPSVIRCTSDSH